VCHHSALSLALPGVHSHCPGPSHWVRTPALPQPLPSPMRALTLLRPRPCAQNPWMNINGTVMRLKPHKCQDAAYKQLLQVQVRVTRGGPWGCSRLCVQGGVHATWPAPCCEGAACCACDTSSGGVHTAMRHWSMGLKSPLLLVLSPCRPSGMPTQRGMHSQAQALPPHRALLLSCALSLLCATPTLAPRGVRLSVTGGGGGSSSARLPLPTAPQPTCATQSRNHHCSWDSGVPKAPPPSPTSPAPPPCAPRRPRASSSSCTSGGSSSWGRETWG